MITYLTYSDLIYDTRQMLRKIPNPQNLAGVLGIPRSGMFPAALIASWLHLPLGEPRTFTAGGFFLPGMRLLDYRRGETILVVDDSAYSGNSMEEVRTLLNDYPSKLLFAAVYRSPEKEPRLDLFGRDIPQQRYFEWNLINHPDSHSFVFDLDGVICYDPDVFDNDGEEYELALEQAEPLELPRNKVHSICTMRLEKWRGVTEIWLARHGVTYGELVMAQFSTADERRSNGNYGIIKGAYYRDSTATLFIESDSSQAAQIATVSGKPVICTLNGRVYQ